jgi:lysyl-tRNA synthetase, class II
MLDQLRLIGSSALRVLGTVLAAAALSTLATGWLYWLRSAIAAWPGPRVKNALPLDELPSHDSVPLLVYVAVLGLAAVIAGLVARAAKLSRWTAGLSLAAATWLWLFAVDAFSLYVVRQVPGAMAVHAAVGLPAIYLAAGLAGAAGALLGRPVPPGAGTHRRLAWLVVACGLADLVVALLPREVFAGVPRWLGPYAAAGAAHALLLPVGLVLLVTSRALVRRNRRALTVAVTGCGASAVLQLLGGTGFVIVALTCLLTIALAARREAFAFRGDPAARPSSWLRLTGTLAAVLAYGVAAFWVHRTLAGEPFRAGPALLDPLRALVGRPPRDIRLRRGEFADWYLLSTLSVLTAGVVWAAAGWLRPWRQRLQPTAQLRSRAAGIVRRWGRDTLAPFALRSDKDWFVAGESLVPYRVVRGVALVSGDPIGPPGADIAALEQFLSFARSRGWRTAILGASDRLASAYRDLGLVPLYHGDEAIIDMSEFSLDGRSMRAVRQAVHRVERNGYRASVVMAGDAPPALRSELTAVEQAWLRGKPRTGFTMELDSLFSLGGDDAAFVLGRDADGQLSGFVHLAVCPASQSVSLSCMPRLPGTPNGLTSWLIVAAVTWARENGYRQLSLNFSPFASLLAAEGQLAAGQRLQRRALLRAKRLLALQLDNLHRFNAQFAPLRQPRYVVVEGRADLPRVVLAAMAAEGYLPFAALVRGRGWWPAGAEATAQPGEPDVAGQPRPDPAAGSDSDSVPLMSSAGRPR